VSSVSTADACPSIVWTAFTLAPALKLVTSNLRTLRMPSRWHRPREAFVMVGDWRPGELGGVAVPVAAGVVDPVDGGGGVDAE
jgi:hypothetical protein